MGKVMMSDFAVASNGHCFFCLRQIMAPMPGRSSVPLVVKQSSSLQYLTRYLKMDLKQVFNNKEQVSLELLTKVDSEKAKLKVELCEECRCLSEKFSELYRQLEKLEIELGSTLRLIHGKLEGAEATTKLHGFTTGLNPNWNGLLEVLDVIRAEAIQKSSCKLVDTPRVKVQNLSTRKIMARQIRLRNSIRSNPKSSQPATSPDFVPHSGLETNAVNVKIESPEDECLSDNDNGNYRSECGAIEYLKMQFSNDGCVSDNDNYLPDDFESNLDCGEPKEKIQSDVIADDDPLSEGPTFEQKVVSRTKNIPGAKKWSINPKTGRRKCKACKREFNSPRAFTLHYRAVHLKLRYNCVSCNKLFSQKSNLRVHQRTSRSCSATGLASKFNCHLCEKSFTHKQTLQRHFDGAHFKLRKYECNLCEKKYNTDTDLRSHRNRVHSGMK